MYTLRKTLTSMTLALAALGLVTVPASAQSAAAEAPKPAAAAKVKGARRPAQKKAAFTGVVHLNTASAEQIAMLPRIGEKVAQRVVDYRQKNGGFKKVEELMNVKGIGAKTFEHLKGQLAL